MARSPDPPLFDRRRVVTMVAALVGFVVLATLLRPTAQAEGTEAPVPSGVAPNVVAQTAGPQGAPTTAPVWVPNVVRIDRSQESRTRVSEDVEGRRRFVGASPLAVAEDASFMTDKGRIRIAGLRLPERTRICRTEDGRRWPCGVRAYAAFSALIVRQRLDCRPMGPADQAVPLFDCMVDRRSIAQVMVSEGWAEADAATADAKLVAIHGRAKTEGLGLWASEPPATSGTPKPPRR